jgi:hypothetical protein
MGEGGKGGEGSMYASGGYTTKTTFGAENGIILFVKQIAQWAR